MEDNKDWRIFRPQDGSGVRADRQRIHELPSAPSWRTFHTRLESSERDMSKVDSSVRGREFQTSGDEVDLVNAALYLRRPLLVTGKPGTGKSALAYAVAYQLRLGPVLRWSITSRSNLQDGLYRYDGIARLHEANLRKDQPENPSDIGRFIRLGPLGSALYPSSTPRVLLIDEIDKSDVDLPSDLLNVFEEGEYDIPELARLPPEIKEVRVMPDDGHADADRLPVRRGIVQCSRFPFIVLTSNGEREFPAPFLRRCLRLDLGYPGQEKLERIVTAHLGRQDAPETKALIKKFLDGLQRNETIATDQLLNAIYLMTRPVEIPKEIRERLEDILLRPLEGGPSS
jgi:MoxR-like ATPase